MLKIELPKIKQPVGEPDPWAVSIAELTRSLERFRLSAADPSIGMAEIDGFDRALLVELNEEYEVLLRRDCAVDGRDPAAGDADLPSAGPGCDPTTPILRGRDANGSARPKPSQSRRFLATDLSHMGPSNSHTLSVRKRDQPER